MGERQADEGSGLVACELRDDLVEDLTEVGMLRASGNPCVSGTQLTGLGRGHPRHRSVLGLGSPRSGLGRDRGGQCAARPGCRGYGAPERRQQPGHLEMLRLRSLLAWGSGTHDGYFLDAVGVPIVEIIVRREGGASHHTRHGGLDQLRLDLRLPVACRAQHR